MAETTEIALPADTWTQLSNGEANVLVQRRSGNVRIAVKTTTPTERMGHNLDGDEPSISFGSLEATDKVWGYCDDANIVVVTK